MIYKIGAVLQPQKFDAVRHALVNIGLDGMTVTDVRGHGRQKGHKESYRGQEYQVDLRPKTLLEVMVTEERKDEIVNVLAAAARTGQIGDGKIFVERVLTAIRIRNNDRDEAAI
jgi:nitrogen regulatory protein P-II 1